MKWFDVLRAQRRFIYLAVALLAVAGMAVAVHLPSAIYPELLFPRVIIVAQGTALDARQVVFSMTRPIEEAVGIVPGVQRVASTSIRGASEINLYFAPSTDMDRALTQVQARVNQIRGQLPAALDIEIERLTPSVFPILSYNLEGGDPATLNDIARYRLRPVLSRIPGVGRVEVQASDTREIEVIADPARLAGQGLTYADLAAAITQATSVDAVGRVSQNYRQYLVVSDQEAHSADDIGAVVLKNGLHVRDIASVTLGTEDHVQVIAGDGRPAALLNITRQIGGNTVSIADSVARVMATLAPTLPPGVHLKAVYDQAALVRDAVASVRDAMIIGASLAVMVLLLFLRHARITAISAASIPLTLMITVFVMSRLGQTFNLMTLGAMAIAIGLVIDDAVVITENIVRHLAPTTDRTVAIRDAVQELIWPVTASTLTTVVVFLPLGLLQGVVGQFFTALSITLTVAVLVSLLLALTIIPLLSEDFLTSPKEISLLPTPRGRGWGARAAEWYEGSLDWSLRYPWVMVGSGLLLLFLSVVVYQHVGTGFLPEMDEGAFVLDYYTPGGTALSESDRMVRVVEQILAKEPEVTGTSRRLGAELGLYATQQNKGDLVVRLKPENQRSRSSFEIIDDARSKINQAAPRVRVEFVQILSDVINDLSGAAHPVEIKLFGDSLEALERYAQSMTPDLMKVNGLEDFYNGVSEPAAEWQVAVNQNEASRIGLAPALVDSAVSSALLGVPAGEIRQEDHAIAVRVRAPDSVRYDPNRLGLLPVLGTKGRSSTPLSALVTMHPTESRAELDRENQQQMIDMTADVGDRSLGAMMGDVKQVLAHHPPPNGIRVEIGGQYANQQAAFRSMLLVLALAAVSVVAIMLLEFRSFVEPLIIVLAAPVSFVGGLTLLWITGTPLNVSSLMGLILLVGLIVKNGIILLDFTRHRMHALGEPLDQALRAAGRVRLRPILMTTLCTLFGLLPLALGLGAGSALQRPLALTVIGGLALSTPITLYMVPAVTRLVRR